MNYYFHKFTGSNPFGFTALDIKALYMGATGCRWEDTRSSKVAEKLKPTLMGTHDALRDALYQAEVFRLIWSGLLQHRDCVCVDRRGLGGSRGIAPIGQLFGLTHGGERIKDRNDRGAALALKRMSDIRRAGAERGSPRVPLRQR